MKSILCKLGIHDYEVLESMDELNFLNKYKHKNVKIFFDISYENGHFNELYNKVCIRCGKHVDEFHKAIVKYRAENIKKIKRKRIGQKWIQLKQKEKIPEKK